MIKDGLNTIQIKDYSVPFIKFGRGDEPIIMIPGLSYIMVPAQLERRRAESETYANDFACYYVERRPNLKEGYTTRQMAEDVYDFICALGLKQVCVQGVSQGGMIAQWLAIDHPEVVKALVLTVTLSKPNETINETTKWLEILKSGDAKQALTYMQKGSFSKKWLEEHKNDPIVLPPPESARPLDQYEILQRACLTHNSYLGLSNIKCPTLVNGGWEDGVVSGHASVEIAEKLKCDLHMDTGLGHGLNEEDVNYHTRVCEWLLSHKQA